MSNAPFLLRPAGKDYLWGGTRLKTEYGKDLPLSPLAETWECSVHPDGSSVVASGIHAGRPLPEVLAEHPEYLGIHGRRFDTLPILVKLIDARQDLSVQVHPDDNYALAHEGQLGKTELWYVVDALPGARLVCGFEHDVTAAQLRAAVADGTLQKHLHSVEVHAGDVFFIPPGTVHAIGAGCLIAEIQESSNVTYRLYDYNRRGKQGNLRPLHVDKALDVLNMKRGFQEKQSPRLIRYRPGCAHQIIGRCAYFQAERLRVSGSCRLDVDRESFQVLLCIRGAGEVHWNNGQISLSAGSCLFIPADMEGLTLDGTPELLRVQS